MGRRKSGVAMGMIKQVLDELKAHQASPDREACNTCLEVASAEIAKKEDQTPSTHLEEEDDEEDDSSSSSSSSESGEEERELFVSTWGHSNDGLRHQKSSTGSPLRSPSRLTPGGSRRRRRACINRRALHRSRREGDARQHFVWNENDLLGSGSFGCVFQGKSRYDSRRVVAVKQVARSAIDDIDQLWAEIGILSELDHPHVLRFLEAYEDRKYAYIVTEVCLGGDLENWLPKVCGNIPFAMRVARETTSALAHCHMRGVCHRDLKLENILLVRDSIDSPIRIADFGVAKRCSRRVLTQRLQWSRFRSTPKAAPSPSKKGLGRRPKRRKPHGVKIYSVAGTPEFMAPEVVRVLNTHVVGAKDQEQRQGAADTFYDFRCDVWSLGVIVYRLITGDFPYTLEQVSAFVAEGAELPNLETLAPEQLREAAAWDFLVRCLNPDFAGRPHAVDLQEDPCLSESRGHVPPTPGSAAQLATRLREFAGLSAFKRAALLAAVRHLTAYEHEQLRALFQRVNTRNSGTLTAQELRGALGQVPVTPSRPPSWIEDLTDHLDSDWSGEVDYTEFLAAAMDHHIEDRRDLAWAAFCSFDLDGDGSISRQELEFVLSRAGADERLPEGSGDDKDALNFERFLSLLRQG
mmetsp:Transcript_163545/g.289479  ORF Transcript_163545/g.289479 Transcript_163545/m.289479 type:complete len:635 (-) Transcript_163545:87-1991(-)